jgi:iron complex outermembrane recepter protein
MSIFRSSCALGAFVTLLAAFSIVPCRAADTAGTDESQGGLSEVVVTAQRRSESLEHAAVAIDVISADALSVTGASRASDLPNSVPALEIGESGHGQQSLYIRSVGTFSANSYSDPAIAFNIDGVAVGRTSEMTGVMYDLQRVEVLKGPQGTLYGRNATGGAINVLPNQPVIGVNSENLALTVGNYGEIHPEGAANFAISDESAARVAFNYAQHDAYQTDGTGDARSYAGRLQYLLRPSDSLSFRVAADYAHDGGHNMAGTLVALQNSFTGAITPFTGGRDVGFQDPRVEALLADRYSFASGRYLEPILGEPREDNRFWGVLAEMTWDSPIGTLTVLPAHRDATLSDFNAALGFGEDTQEHDDQTSVEIRLASANAGPLKWILGGFYFNEGIHALYQFNQQFLLPIQDFDTGTQSGAGFAHLVWSVTDRLRLTGGLRYTHDRKTIDGLETGMLSVCTRSTPIPACPQAPLIPYATNFAQLSSQLQLFPIVPNSLYGSSLPGAQNSVFPLISLPLDQSQTFTKTTWHTGLEYDLTPESLLYGRWDTGYHAGGFAFAQIEPTYKPEWLSAFSVGSKNQLLHDRLQVNLEGFYWEYRNQQIPHGATDYNGDYVFITDNAGASIIKGGEIEVKFLPLRQTLLTLDVQYLDAVYTKFVYQTPAGGTNTPPVTACPYALTDPTHYTVNCAGKTAQQSPRWSGNVGVQHTILLPSSYELTGGLTTHYQSLSYVGFELLPVETQGSYAESNFALTLRPGDERWSATAFVNNMQDKRPYGVAYFGPTNVFAASVGPPRTWGMRVDMKW